MTKPPHKPFNIKLSDEHRAKLEAYRAKQGLRSEADAVRHLIDQSAIGEGQFNELLRVGAAVEAVLQKPPIAVVAGAMKGQPGPCSAVPFGQTRKATPKAAPLKKR